jgi:hypothetical protein
MPKGHSRFYYQKQHKKEVIWQILLPIGIGALAFLALGIMAAFSLQSGTESAARWGHIAVMWMILPVFAAGLFAFILIVGLNIGIAKIQQILPDYTEIVQIYAQKAFRLILGYANRSVKPIITIQTIKAQTQRFWLSVQYAIFGGYKD